MIPIHKSKQIKNKIVTYNTNRIKPIKIHKSKFLYYNNFILKTNISLYINIFFFKLNILNFFNHVNVLLVDDFLLVYTTKYITNATKYCVYYNYKKCIIRLIKLVNNMYAYIFKQFNKSIIYYYILVNKYLYLTSISLCIFLN